MAPELKGFLIALAGVGAFFLTPYVRHSIQRIRYFRRVAPWRGQPVSSVPSETAKHQLEMLNDDRTGMEFVVRVLQCCFGMSRPNAIRQMLEVHGKGSAIVGYASKDVAEGVIAHVSAQAKLCGFPLQVRLSDAQQRVPADGPASRARG